jgi:flagellar biosynthesis GTPase FlhF
MAALGTYSVLLVQPNNRMLLEIVQAPSSAEATEKVKKLYPDCAYLETKTKVMSEGEANKAAAAKEAATIKKAAAAKKKQEKVQASRDARKKAKK